MPGRSRSSTGRAPRNTMDALPFSIGSSLLGGASSLFDKGLGFYGKGYFSTRNPSSQPSLPGTNGPIFT